MKRVNFTQMAIKNFLSIGEEPVVIRFDSGLHIITGNNLDKSDRRNGVGKSTIGDALFFAVFDTTIRDIKKNLIPCDRTTGTCTVGVKFEINGDRYEVVRTLRSSSCSLYKNDEDITRDIKANTATFLQDLLGVTPEIFKHCITLTINETTPFMAMKKAPRKKFIDSILNFDIYTDMARRLKDRYNDVLRDFDKLIVKHEQFEENIKSYKLQFDSFEDNRRKRLSELEIRKADVEDDIRIVESKKRAINIDDIENIRKSLEKYETRLSKCRRLIKEQNSAMSSHKTAVRMYKTSLKELESLSGTCPTCKRPVPEHGDEHIDAEKRKLDAEIEKETDLYVECSDTIEALDEKFKETDKLIGDCKKSIAVHDENVRELRSLDKQIDIYTKSLHTIQNDINETRDTVNNFDVLFDEANNNLANLTVQLDSVRKELNILETAKLVLSEEGVKSFVIKKVLQLLNNKITYYLNRLDANCVCVFDEYFDEMIVNENGIEKTYNSFSGAERKTIDLACMFAFMDIQRMQNSISCNVCMYDELLDSSFDAKGIELVLNILNERVEEYKECIMIISHRKESATFATGEVINLVKENGVTTRS